MRQKSGNYARRAIGHALQERGVSREVAKAALAEAGPGDELEEAHALWQRRFGSAPGNEREKARQLRFLVSRGFPVSIAYRVLRQAGARVDEE